MSTMFTIITSTKYSWGWWELVCVHKPKRASLLHSTIVPFSGRTLALISQPSDTVHPPGVYILHSLPPLDIHKQWLISARYTWNSFRRTRLISSSSDVILTKSAWSDGSLLCPLWRDLSDVVYPPDTVCICIYTHEKKRLLGCKQPRKALCSLWSHFPVWIKDQILECFDCLWIFNWLINQYVCVRVYTSFADQCLVCLCPFVI